MALFLWIFAVMLFVSGLGLLIRGQMLWGIAIMRDRAARRPGWRQPLHLSRRAA